MLILITLQEPKRTRIRVVVSAPSTFEAVDKVMSTATHNSAPFNVNTYVAARPATQADLDQYGRWEV